MTWGCSQKIRVRETQLGKRSFFYTQKMCYEEGN